MAKHSLSNLTKYNQSSNAIVNRSTVHSV